MMMNDKSVRICKDPAVENVKALSLHPSAENGRNDFTASNSSSQKVALGCILRVLRSSR